MTDDGKNRLEEMGREMGEQRQELAKLLRELAEDHDHLERVRRRYDEIGDALTNFAGDVDKKRQRAFAMKMKLEGRQKAQLGLKRRPTLDPSEQRNHPRLPYQLHVNFGGLKAFYSGFAVNISDGGMLVATLNPPEIAQRFAVEFELDGKRTIRCPVEAVWLAKVTEQDDAGQCIFEVGLRFIDMLPEDRDAVRAFTASYIDRWLTKNDAGAQPSGATSSSP